MAPVSAFLIVFATGFLAALLITPVACRIGHKAGIVSKPGGRRKHEGSIPRTGGISLFAAFILALIVSQLFVVNPNDVPDNLPATLTVLRFDPKEVIRLAGLIGGTALIFVIGMLDDRLELPPLVLYIGQLAAGSIAVLFLIFIEYVNNPFSGLQTADFPYLFTIVITLFWIGLLTNTVNFLDGVDGLATGVVALACLVLFLNAAFRLEPAQYSVALMPLALLGATLGFLPYNFAPARIFLGGGAYLLGYLLGLLSIIGGAKVATILLVMGLPLLDTVWQIVNRVARGQNPAVGDRGHLHFRLVDMGVPQTRIVLGYYLFCAVFGGLSLIIPSQIYKFVALVVMAAISAGGFAWTTLRAPTDPGVRPEAKPEGDTP